MSDNLPVTEDQRSPTGLMMMLSSDLVRNIAAILAVIMAGAASCGSLPTPPSVLRTATSPFRGGIRKPNPLTPVTLNSFQGPFLGLRRRVVEGANLAAARSTHLSRDAARWMLKQVQHDGLLWEAAE